MPVRSRRLRLLLMPLALVTSFALGYASNQAVQADAPPEPAMPFPQLETFARVLSHIERSYVESVESADLVYGAIKGMVDTLDPHSSFLSPDEYQSMRNETRGEYVGVGMELGMRDGNVTVIAPFEGGPAYEAGIETGDIVLAVDGEDVHDALLQDVIERLRGERGAPVALLVRRTDDSGESTELSFTLVRDVIHVQSVDSQLVAPGYGLVSINTFQLGVSADVVAAIDALTVENEAELEGLILDLRSNPGGLLSEGVGVADVFLDEGVIVTTEGRNSDENTVHESHDGNTRYQGPLVVLVNGGTASASEIVAGALQDRERATLIGTTTFGKATVQTIIDFPDGSGLKLTVAHYFSPSHRAIHGTGIVPDATVSAATLDSAAVEPPAAGFSAVTDAQVQAALDELRRMD